MLIINGVPLFFMELAIGQWYSSGVIGVWKSVCPLMKGKTAYLSNCNIFVLVRGLHATVSKTTLSFPEPQLLHVCHRMFLSIAQIGPCFQDPVHG